MARHSIFAVISDVHSNLEALNAVLEDLKKRSVIDIYFLGDAVGYGPDPDECLSILKTECRVLLAGNHDWGVCGLTDIDYFNAYARSAVEWTRDVMNEENIRLLRTLPVIFEQKTEDIILVHSTPHEPEQWHYMFSQSDAEFNFHYFTTQLCFTGHSHYPVIIERLSSGEMLMHREAAPLNEESRYIINAGSIGQPRDGDPRASYVIVHDGRADIIRVPYDISATQKKMRQAGLPDHLIQRLSMGM